MNKTTAKRCYKFCLNDTISIVIKITAIVILLALSFMFGRMSSPYNTFNDVLSTANSPTIIQVQQTENKVEARQVTSEVVPATDFLASSLLTLTDATVKSITKNELTIGFIDSQPGTDGKREIEKTLIIPSSLLVEVHVEKKSSDLNSEIEKLKNEQATSDNSIEPYTIEKKSLNYLKKGDVVTITTKDDIRSKDKPTATSIILYELTEPELATEKKEG